MLMPDAEWDYKPKILGSVWWCVDQRRRFKGSLDATLIDDRRFSSLIERITDDARAA